MIHKANGSIEKRKYLEKLIKKCEEFKMLVFIAKELKIFKSFKQFENISKMSVNICKQSQAWYNHYAGVTK